MNHINSTSRDILNGKTPYDATLLMLDEETIEKLGVATPNLVASSCGI